MRPGPGSRALDVAPAWCGAGRRDSFRTITRVDMRLGIVLILVLQVVPRGARAQPRTQSITQPKAAVVRALIPVLVSLLDSIRAEDEPDLNVWRIDAPGIPVSLRRQLRDALLHAAHGRAAVASDTLARVLSVSPADFSGDSAEVEVAHGTESCRHGWSVAGGTTYLYVFTRAGDQWRYRHRRPDIAYDPVPPPRPRMKAPGCSLAASR